MLAGAYGGRLKASCVPLSSFRPRGAAVSSRALAMSSQADRDVREALFLKHFLAGKTRREAAILAGFSPRSASQSANALLKRKRVQQTIADFHTQTAEETQILRQLLVRQLTQIALFDLASVLDADSGFNALKSSLPEGALTAVASLRSFKTPEGSGVVVKAHDKVGAIKLLLGITVPPETHVDLEEAGAEVLEQLEAMIQRIHGSENAE